MRQRPDGVARRLALAGESGQSSCAMSTSRRIVLDLLTAPAKTHFAPDVRAFLPAPLAGCEGVDALFEALYFPLQASFGTAAMQPQLTAADHYSGADWVAVMASLNADQNAAFLGVPPGPDRQLRFGLFFKVEGGLVSEIRVLFDLIGLASQAEIDLLPPFEGRKTMPLPGDDLTLHLNAAR